MTQLLTPGHIPRELPTPYNVHPLYLMFTTAYSKKKNIGINLTVYQQMNG